MATISDINQASSYTGVAELGGDIGVAAKIDPAPLQRLATFAYYRDRDLWEQKNKNDATAADQIAAMTAYDITSPLEPFSADLKATLDRIKEYTRANPDSLVYGRNPAKYTERMIMINDFLTKRKAATANDVLYNAAKNGADKITNLEERALRQAEVKSSVTKLFSGGVESAYNKTLSALPDIKPSDYVIPDANATKRTFIKTNPNDNTKTTLEYIDLENLRGKSAFAASDSGEVLDETTTAFQQLTPEEQDLQRQRAKMGATPAERRKLQARANDFNVLKKAWEAAHPGVDLNTVDVNTLGDGTFANMVRSMRTINDQTDELNGYVKQGIITDPNGFTRTKEYEKINIADGIDETEVTYVAALQKQGNLIIKTIEKDPQYHGGAIRSRGQELDYASALSRSKPTGDPYVDAIENPARSFDSHMGRVQDYYSSKNVPKGQYMVVAYSALDPDTRQALGIPAAVVDADAGTSTDDNENSFVVYKRDGSFKTGTDKDGNGGTPGTLDQLVKGYIDVVKSGIASKGGVQSEGFQTNAETGFYKIFGSNDPQYIWNNRKKGGGGYIEIKTIGGVRYGLKQDGTVEKIQ